MASPSGDTRILREPCEEDVEPVPGKWLRIEASDKNIQTPLRWTFFIYAKQFKVETLRSPPHLTAELFRRGGTLRGIGSDIGLCRKRFQIYDKLWQRFLAAHCTTVLTFVSILSGFVQWFTFSGMCCHWWQTIKQVHKPGWGGALRCVS